jgi:hypothetical protein
MPVDSGGWCERKCQRSASLHSSGVEVLFIYVHGQTTAPDLRQLRPCEETKQEVLSSTQSSELSLINDILMEMRHSFRELLQFFRTTGNSRRKVSVNTGIPVAVSANYLLWRVALEKWMQKGQAGARDTERRLDARPYYQVRHQICFKRLSGKNLEQ